MPQFLLNKRLILLLVGVIILVALIGFSLKDERNLSWPEQFIKDTTGLVQSVFHRPAQYVAGFFENIQELKNTYKENEILRSQLNQYMQLKERMQRLEEENQKLKEELGIVNEGKLSHYEAIRGTVIARNPDKWNELIIIDKGELHGVEKDMAVITAKGLIGKVKSTSQFTSTIQLLSAPDRENRISAVVTTDNGKVFGLIEGYDKDTKALEMKIIETDTEVKEKQMVSTSGMGGVFPEGLLIGEVMKVEPDSYGLTKIAYVQPAADFYDIDRVMVVKREAPIIDLNDLTNKEEKE
ncbi:rod shape-determining protein MreC [Bacillus alveayuensis]|jgi:rod shape-determining protein MreC|uniref:rod shape-determining protein MreC n=1 Tax=Aeribacillus alveayuensis TaxID=279215 RepID=UPI0005D114B7|nr:rod shape-determining protein MreC [Bacillus alveayuensis]